MQGATDSPQDPRFLCVVAAEYPIYCNKCFPSIEKHNEHLKRFHSPIFWCDKCLHKFSSSLTNKLLNLSKTDHDKNHCTGEPSEKSRKTRDEAWVMDRDQYHRFKEIGWKKTVVPKRIYPNGRPETLSEKSWRQIRQTIFPYSEEMIFLNSAAAIFPGLEESPIELTTPPALSRSTEDVITIVTGRRSSIMPQLTDVPSLSRDMRQGPTLIPVPPSMTTDTQLSTQSSWETGSQTHPSSHVLSHSGADGHQMLDDIEFGKPTDPKSSPSHTREMSQGQQASEFWMSGTGAWSGPLPEQTIMNFGHHFPRKATDQE